MMKMRMEMKIPHGLISIALVHVRCTKRSRDPSHAAINSNLKFVSICMIYCSTSTISNGRCFCDERLKIATSSQTNIIEQVLSSQSSISMLSKPCSICSARSRSQCENEGKSDSSRSSSRRGSSSIQGSSGDGSRRSSVLPHLHGGNADQSSVPLFTAQHSSPVSASPDKPSISGHTIIAASLRLFSRRNVATQSSGHITQAGENLVASNSDSLQVVVSVKDR